MRAFSRSSRCFAVAVLALVPACSSVRYFRPAEKATAESRLGHPAAEYELGTEGVRWGEARVWSDGARWREDAAGVGTVVHIGFEVENVTDGPLEILADAVRITSVDVAGHAIEPLAPRAIVGESRIDAHKVGAAGLEFALPRGVRPRDIDGFQLQWSLRGPEDWVYEQSMRFLPYSRNAHYWPHGPHIHFGYWFGPSWCW